MGTQHRGTRRGRTRNAKDFLLLVRSSFIPFRGKPYIPERKLLELATGEGTKSKLVGCSFTTDMMHQLMSASIIQFVPTNPTNRFEQIGVSVRVLTRSVTDTEPPSPETMRRA
jgi:hypothetical protein